MSRALPTESHDAASLHTWWSEQTADADDATDDAPNGTAWWLIVPYHDINPEWDPPEMDEDERTEHWKLICDAGRDNLQIPRTLEWSDSPRTRALRPPS